jgi:FkbM family methyltransferase
VIDVGANIGDFSIQSARLCPQGKIYAIDPIKEHCERVAEHIKLNAIENVQIFQLALGGTTGDVEIRSDGSRSSTQWGSGMPIRTLQVTLPEFMRINHVEKIDLLKLDCEGAEWDILPAAESVLPVIRQICLEYHNGKLNADWLAPWLSARGYTVRRTFGQWNGLLWAWR